MLPKACGNLLLAVAAIFCYSHQMPKPKLLDFVYEELESRKGDWPRIAKSMEPESWKSYYSWLTKFARKRIPDPSVNKVQRLADYFGQHPRG